MTRKSYPLGSPIIFITLLSFLVSLSFPQRAVARKKSKVKKGEVAEQSALPQKIGNDAGRSSPPDQGGIVEALPRQKKNRGTAGPSLWGGEYDSGSSLFKDLKARGPGDLLTVHILESSTAENKANTSTSRKADTTVGIPHFFGFEVETKNHVTHGFDSSKLISGTSDGSFQGTGSTARSNKITAVLTAKVVEVLPGGNLLIEGRREIIVNAEKHFITLRGTVRPMDISPENVILSTAIADLGICYSGKGPVARRQKPGWFLKVLSLIWPF